MNIVVAVLLDEFITTVAKEKAEKRQRQLKELEESKHKEATPDGPLDALVRSLMVYTNQDDLMRRISNLYARLDLDESGAIDLNELNEGLKKIPATANVVLSQDDFNIVTNNRALLNEEGELTPAAFEVMMLTQVKSFSQRKVVAAMARDHDEDTDDLVFALKSIMSTLDHVDSTVSSSHGMASHKPYLKSRKEVLNRLFKSSQITMFNRWKEAVERASRLCAESGDGEGGITRPVGGPGPSCTFTQADSIENAGAMIWTSSETSALPSMEVSEKMQQHGEELRQLVDSEQRRERQERKRHVALETRQAAIENELRRLRSDQEEKMGSLNEKLEAITNLLLQGQRGDLTIGSELAESAMAPQKSVDCRQHGIAEDMGNVRQPTSQTNNCSPRSQQISTLSTQAIDSLHRSGAGETRRERADQNGCNELTGQPAFREMPVYSTQPLSLSLWKSYSLPSTPSEPGSPEQEAMLNGADIRDSFRRVSPAQSGRCRVADSHEKRVLFAPNINASSSSKLESDPTTLGSDKPHHVRPPPVVRDERASLLVCADCVGGEIPRACEALRIAYPDTDIRGRESARSAACVSSCDWKRLGVEQVSVQCRNARILLRACASARRRPQPGRRASLIYDSCPASRILLTLCRLLLHWQPRIKS